MEYVVLSDLKDRIVKLSWSKGERYAEEATRKSSPWWNFHVIIKTPFIDFDVVSESMQEFELKDLYEALENRKNFDEGQVELVEFMEPDYQFGISKDAGYLNIHLGYSSSSNAELILNNNSIYSDSLKIELSCENLDDIARYIKKILITT